MSIEDILTLPEIFTIDGKEYKSEFDCKSYGMLEAITGKSIYKIQDRSACYFNKNALFIAVLPLNKSLQNPYNNRERIRLLHANRNRSADIKT